MTEKRFRFLLVLILFCILCLVPAIADTSTEYWAPWVTKTTTTSATINWWQESLGSGWTVHYASASYYDEHGKFDHSVPDPAPGPANFHQVLLTGLEPNTTYKYLVEPMGSDPSGKNPVFSVRRFQTFPVSGPFTFIVISDTHANDYRFKYVADALSNEQGALFILLGGDYSNNDNASQWTDFFDYGDGMLANYSIYTNIGNHEYHNITGDNSSTDAYEYRNAFDYPLYYSFDCAGIRFVVLDSPDPNSTNDQNPTLAHSESQVSWLKDQLDNTMSGTFVIDHHPIWTYGRATSESALQPWEALFQKYPVSADFAGHIHSYQRFSVNGIPYFIVANGGGKFISLSDGKPFPPSYVFNATKELGYLQVMVDPANNTATANEYFVASLPDYDSRTGTVISPPLLADTITFPLKRSAIWTVCPSGCNYSKIQDAINAASPGDTIGIQSGVYHEALIVNKRLTLTGIDTGQGYPVIDAGKSGVGISVEAAGCNLEKFEVRNASHSAIIVGADNSDLDNLKIDHKGAGPAISGDKVTGFACSNSRFNTDGETIVLQDSHDFSITNNTITNPTGNAVAIVSSNRKKPVTNGSISDNFITQELGSGIEIVAEHSDSFIENLVVQNNTIRGAGGSIGIFIPSRNVTIQGNTITNNPGIPGIGIYGIMTFGTSGVIVRNNTVHDAQVELAYRFESCDGLNISGNRAISNSDTGIGLIAPTNCVMTNNVMEGNPYNFLLYPELLDNGRLPGNRIDTTNLVDGRPVLYYEGINNLHIDGSLQPGTVFLYGCNNATVWDIHEEANDAGITAFNSDDLSITNCSLENMDTGIYTVQSDGLLVQNNKVNGCFDGIMVGAFSSGIVTGNLVENSGDSGIVAGQSLDNVSVYGNDIRNSKVGIYLDTVSGSGNVVFSKNLISGSQVAGISANQAGGCAFTGNLVNAASGVGLDIEQSSGLTFTGNTIRGNAVRGVLLFESPKNNISTNNISAGEEGFMFTRLAGDSGSSDNRITNNLIDAIVPAGFYIQKGTDVVTPKFNRSLETPVDEIPAMVLTSNTTTSAGEGTGFKPDHSPPGNTWNLSVTAGSNIVGGPYLGGNYWENPRGNGFSQTHPDRGDGFCNESYVLGKGNTDYLPLHVYTPKPSFYADFVISPIAGTAPLTVKCTDKSIGNPSMLVYNFGDGINVTGPNPTHTYRFPGVYTVTLSIMKYNTTSNSIMNSVAIKPNIVTVNNVPLAPLVANFTAGPVNGTSPLTVSFSDHSTGDPTFYSYDFGDGVNMTGPNPVHTYWYPGNYTVRLTVMKNDAANVTLVANSSVRQDYIVIQGK